MVLCDIDIYLKAFFNKCNSDLSRLNIWTKNTHPITAIKYINKIQSIMKIMKKIIQLSGKKKRIQRAYWVDFSRYDEQFLEPMFINFAVF